VQKGPTKDKKESEKTWCSFIISSVARSACEKLMVSVRLVPLSSFTSQYMMSSPSKSRSGSLAAVGQRRKMSRKQAATMAKRERERERFPSREPSSSGGFGFRGGSERASDGAREAGRGGSKAGR
jgi:hypothetical protein